VRAAAGDDEGDDRGDCSGVPWVALDLCHQSEPCGENERKGNERDGCTQGEQRRAVDDGRQGRKEGRACSGGSKMKVQMKMKTMTPMKTWLYAVRVARLPQAAPAAVQPTHHARQLGQY
jgi:hypothetical protein